MSEDIANNIEIMPAVVGTVVSVILILLFPFINLFAVMIGSAISGFLTRNSTMYALISGAIVGIVSSFAMFTVFTLPIYLVLGLFGAFIGKVLQSNFSS